MESFIVHQATHHNAALFRGFFVCLFCFFLRYRGKRATRLGCVFVFLQYCLGLYNGVKLKNEKLCRDPDVYELEFESKFDVAN